MLCHLLQLLCLLLDLCTSCSDELCAYVHFFKSVSVCLRVPLSLSSYFISFCLCACVCVCQYEAEGGIPLPEVLERCIALCTRHHEELPHEQQQRIIARADTDHDGRLDYNEFVRLVS